MTTTTTRAITTRRPTALMSAAIRLSNSGDAGPELMAGGWPPNGGCRNGTGVLSARRRRLRCGWVLWGEWSCRLYVPDPNRSFPWLRRASRMTVMQVMASQRAVPGRPTRIQMLSSFSAGTILLLTSATVLYLVFAAGFLDQFTPAGRPTTYEVVSGALAWTFALTAPAAAGLVGLLRLATAYERFQARRPRVTPAVRLARAIGDDHIVATGLRLPDGSRIVPELVIGPFGAAVIEELPAASSVLSRGVRSWEIRAGVGNVRTI